MAKQKRSKRQVSSILLSKTFLSTSAAQTLRIGRMIARELKPGVILCLHGELGSGKTTLVQGIAAGLGVKGFVRSSSFILANEYKTAKPDLLLYHIDLYRLGADDIEGFGIDEYLHGKGICIIEWAERIKHLNLPCWDVLLSWQGENERKIEVLKAGIRGRRPGAGKIKGER